MRTRQEVVLRAVVFPPLTVHVYIWVLHDQHFRVPRLAWLVLNWVHVDLVPYWFISGVFHLLSSVKAQAPTINLLLLLLLPLLFLQRRFGGQVGNFTRSHVGKIGRGSNLVDPDPLHSRVGLSVEEGETFQGSVQSSGETLD